MIALNMDMPKKCLECPCMWTIVCQSMDDEGKKYCFRYCAAKSKEIYVCPESDNMPEEWMKFKKPDFCPWIEIK